jgi:Cu-processing system ATP-binding protein
MLIRFDNVTKSYENLDALKDINFQAAAGEIVALCGPNGAGKTTFLELAIGLIRPSLGKVTIMGEDPSRNWQIKRTIGYAGDPGDLIGELTVEELLCYMERMRSPSVPTDTPMQSLLEAFQLTPKRHEWICNLSDGMRRKTAILQALVGSPSLLILDEPTSGLDIEVKQVCGRLLAEKAAQGATLLIATHDFRLLDAIQPRILMLVDGQIAADGRLANLLTTHTCTSAEELILKLWPQRVSA